MKYIVERASTFFHEEKQPCKEAHLEQILHTDERTIDDPMKNPHIGKSWYEEEDYFNHRVENGHIKRDYWRNEWVIEINTLEELMQFINSYGNIIVEKKDYSAPMPKIVIYDSWVE